LINKFLKLKLKKRAKNNDTKIKNFVRERYNKKFDD